jgi:hypothetical protein
MSNPVYKYGVDRAREAQGSEVVIDDMTFKVRSASASNRGYRYALAIAASKHRDELKADTARAFDLHEDVLIEAFADGVILGWNGVDGEDGQPLEFNRENCIHIMQSCPAIWDQIKEVALDDDRFKFVKEDGDQLGKS